MADLRSEMTNVKFQMTNLILLPSSLLMTARKAYVVPRGGNITSKHREIGEYPLMDNSERRFFLSNRNTLVETVDDVPLMGNDTVRTRQ